MSSHMDAMFGRVENRFSLAMLAARRARQVTDYFNAVSRHEYTDIPGPDIDRINDKPLTVAFDEIAHGLVDPIWPSEEDPTEIPD